MTKRVLFFVLAILVIAFVLTMSRVQSRPWRLALLPDKGENFGCGTCHINPAGGGPRNVFGQDFAKIGLPAGDVYTDELSALDSDGDGFTNQQEFDAGTHPADPNSIPEEKPVESYPSEPVGQITPRDENARSDKLVIQLTDVPQLPPLYVYEGWLLSYETEEELNLGLLTPDTNGKIEATYVSETGENLVGFYTDFYVTIEPTLDSDTAPPSVTVYYAYLPLVALQHIRHLLYQRADTPGNIGYAIGLVEQAEALLTHAENALFWANEGDFDQAKRHTEHTVNILVGEDGADYGDLNGDGNIQNPGDGFGLLPADKDKNGDAKVNIGYASGTYDHTELATLSDDATDEIKTHGEHVKICVDNIIGKADQPEYPDWSHKVLTHAMNILAVAEVNEAKAHAEEMVKYTERLLHGVDADGDGKIEPAPGEGGALTAYEHAQNMARYYPLPSFTPPKMSNFTLNLPRGLNMISIPLMPETPYTAKTLSELLGATIVVMYDEQVNRFNGYIHTPGGGEEGFTIEGGRGYIVNLMSDKEVTFKGYAWTDEPMPAPLFIPQKDAWAFIVSCKFDLPSADSRSNEDYTLMVKNLRTGIMATDSVSSVSTGRFAAVFADLNRRPVVKVGDALEIVIKNGSGTILRGPVIYQISLDDIAKAFADVSLRFGHVIPQRSMLFQNYPNPFNPETWIPYQLAKKADVNVKIYAVTGNLVRSLPLEHKDAGIYTTKDEAIYWDGRNSTGAPVSSGVYFYVLSANDFTAVKKMVILK